MSKVNNIKELILETINDYDYLNTTKDSEIIKYNELLSTNNFIASLIRDVIHNFDEAIKFDSTTNLTSTISDLDILDGDEDLDVDIDGRFNYIYDGKKIPLVIEVVGNKIPYKLSSSYEIDDYNNESGSILIDDVDFSDVDVNIYDVNKNLLPIVFNDKANKEERDLFIRRFIEPYFNIRFN